MAKLSPRDFAGLEHMQWFQSVGGYNAMNSSRPQTVAVGLSDSPAGQLAWNELFLSFGNGTSLVSPDQVLTEVSLEWFTNTSATAGRYHFEEARAAPSRRSTPPRWALPCSPTTSGRSARRRARQQRDRALERVRPGRPLREPGGAGSAGRGPARLLRHRADA
jgi:hypothetical protein